ncbi:hypothetical protein HRbin29_01941 [bacterium HR29]|nr:hypothetical protein HRbin29_01941 [bacterium HR29]
MSGGPGSERTRSFALADWVRAALLGARDTAKTMLEEARAGAREGYEEGWRRFEAKTGRPRRQQRQP